MKKYTQILADYLADLKYEDIPAEVIERAKMVTLHTVGVALGAAKAKTVREAIEVAKVMGESERGATIFGDGSKVSVTSAAFANGMMSDFLDWEDCSWTGHPCSGAVPAGLAVAEAYGRSGKDYLTSFVGGFEVYQRIAMAVQPTPERFDAGWGLYCWQIFAPTAVSGKLLGLSADKLNQLIGTAAGMCPVATEQINATNTDFYHYTYGLTAKMGVECSLIVDKGITTLRDALEEYGGYWFGVSDQCDWDWFDKELGSHYYLMDMLLKNWPANMWIQAPLDLLHRMVTANGIKADDIESIEMSPFIPNRSENWPEGYPSTVRAQFSIPFCLAMYLRGPQLGWEWAEEKYLRDPVILEMANRFKGVGRKERVSSQFDRFREGGYPTYEMKITLKDGTAYEDSIQFPKGHPQNPYTREECIENFRVATATIFTAEQCDKLVDLIMNRLEDVEDLSILGEYLKA